ncbi:MAG: beta-N-acetylhexosaminidase [Proteobacteria bacterium]|nr:beta-N-acetylhexosaminidase [Pseudomonadota bacterium]MBT6657467.1 beta-N-acetylhexosaminidase [Pseudomonadota bacterium]MBT6932160.1 beta-N-acetylhexosaminidase [Pseudomonadota bacterium]MBT7110770.1 beta-N-acetylhexosaminidase [Pseudomonadota bacterium]MBT7965381.1 beta-N-acetylhexosaminidase [Pseudomonadota bacterium]
MNTPLALGQLMISVEGTTLDSQSRHRLLHPDVGGVILFSRNYENRQQLIELIQEIHDLRHPSLLVAVDQEGGVVQRFKSEFTVLPNMAMVGEAFEQNTDSGLHLALDIGRVLGYELRTVGVDFSFTPVVDLESSNIAIGRRSFHRSPEVVSALSRALANGLSEMGMQAVAKHFPGHSGVVDDPHFDLPSDGRQLEEVRLRDMAVYQDMESQGINAVMTCHVVFPNIDKLPATFSSLFINKELRHRLGFNGLIVSDDIMMGALSQFGDPVERVIAARRAGCDLILLCNSDHAADEVLGGPRLPQLSEESLERLSKMKGSQKFLQHADRFNAARQKILELNLDH